MKTIFGLAACLILAATVAAQSEWNQFPGNPVGNPSMLDGATPGFYGPDVVFQGGKFHLWYTRKSDNVENVGYWTSTDGKAWTFVDSSVLKPSGDAARFDDKKVGQPAVIADGNTLKMWFWGAGAGVGSIGYATSTDGKAWTKVDGPKSNKSVFDIAADGGSPVALATPCVIKDGDTYKMWYGRLAVNGSAIAYTIGYATSPDGVAWTVAGSGGAVLTAGAAGKFDSAGVFFPSVVKDGSTYRMWYSGQAEDGGLIGYATSADGVAWTRVDGSLAKGGMIAGMTCSILMMDNGYYMWFVGEAGVNLATSGLPVGIGRPARAPFPVFPAGPRTDALGKSVRAPRPDRSIYFAR
jgi:predicted GH43/DUF377 family glycosyl hydrolase